MIASAIPTDHQKFLGLLPVIRRQALVAFQGEPLERRRELVAEVIANAWVAFQRLIKRGLEQVIYPTPLAGYAIKQVRCGRRVGTQLNVRDLTSEYCQRAKGIAVTRLDAFDDRDAQWKEVLVEDHRATPAEIAACRIDFAAWLETLPCRERRIAKLLSTGETTNAAAKKFRLSPARVSQLRRELQAAWHMFVGEDQLAVA